MKLKLKALNSRLIILSFAITIHLLFSPWLSDNWFGDLLNHFRPFEIIFLVLILNILFLRIKWPIVILVNLLFVTYVLYEEFKDVETAKSKDISLQVISFNVLTSNPSKKEVISWIRSKVTKERNNVVFLMETNRLWVNELEQLKDILPYMKAIPREDNFGITILADTNLEDIKVTFFDENKIPAFSGSLLNGQIDFYGIHPLPPMGKIRFDSRNSYFVNVRDQIDSNKKPVVIAGDFNCTPWSSNIDKIMNSNTGEDRKLFYSENGLFRPHTWGVFNRILSIPIDHVVFTKSFYLESTDIGPELGSDHLPIITRFR